MVKKLSLHFLKLTFFLAVAIAFVRAEDLEFVLSDSLSEVDLKLKDKPIPNFENPKQSESLGKKPHNNSLRESFEGNQRIALGDRPPMHKHSDVNASGDRFKHMGPTIGHIRDRQRDGDLPPPPGGLPPRPRP